MKKRRLSALFAIVILIYVSFVYAQPLPESPIDPELEEFKRQGFQFTGYIYNENGILVVPENAVLTIIPSTYSGNIKVKGGTVEITEYFRGKVEVEKGTVKLPNGGILKGNIQYDQSIRPPTLTVSKGGSAKIPGGFNGNIVVKSEGGIDIPQNFLGDVKVEGGTVKLPNSLVFSGQGSYSKQTEFIIKDGLIYTTLGGDRNIVHIQNGYSVMYNGKEITGVAGPKCEPDCRINDEKIGKDTRFFYSEEDDQEKLTIVGKPTITTLPGANIKMRGLKAYLGDMELNIPYSEIYLKQGDSINVEGISSPLIAKGKVVRLFFERDGINTIKPVLRRRFEDLKNEVSISDVFEKAGYGKDNKIARGEWYYSMYGEDYSLKDNRDQNIKALNDLKSGKLELYYNDEDSNVQIGRTEPNSGRASALIKPSVDEKLRKNAENFANKNIYGFEKILEKQLPGDTLSLSERIEEEAEKRGVNPEDFNRIKALVLSESSGNPKAISIDKDGINYGILQVREGVVRQLKQMYPNEKWDLNKFKTDPIENLRVGIAYFKYVSKETEGNPDYDIAAYKAGPSRVERYARKGVIPKSTRYQVYKVNEIEKKLKVVS